MSYQALYRKWRPSGFDEMVGQDAVVMTLKNQIRSGRIGHAYLFCGTRGTGKTSAAKIFARAVNCPHAAEHGGSPCNECETCKSIASGSAMNVFEIDAASNNGVDNIRDIREQVEYPPVTGRYKVYIIDEVHMLSAGAFNALLKTLEEPPAYVIFILATTDPQKIPATILSRCQRYDFRRISKATIAGHLKDITDREGISVEDKALAYIAEAADGSMRDSLSILDQCLAYHYGDVLSYEHVLDILGAADDRVYSGLYRQLISHDAEGAIAAAAELNDAGCEPGVIISELLRHLRDILIVKSSQSRDAVDISDEKYELARADAELSDRDTLIYIISSLAELANRLRFSSQKRIGLEVELIRLSALGTAAMRPQAGVLQQMNAAVNTTAGQQSGNVRAAGAYGTANAAGYGGATAAANAAGMQSMAQRADTSGAHSGETVPWASDRQSISAKITVNISDRSNDSGRDILTAGQGQHAAAAGDYSDNGQSSPQNHAGGAADNGQTAGRCSGITADGGNANAQNSGSSAVNIDDSHANDAAVSTDTAYGDAAGILDIVKRNWSILLGELSASNRPLFNDVLIKEEHGNIVLVFGNKMKFKMAAGNAQENGLIRLRELAQQKLGMRINFRAREARPGEVSTEKPRATQEELAKINFPISIED